jgi:sugar lactone lactonase YvrE
MPSIANCLPGYRAILGENPFWDGESQRLFWIDGVGRTLFCQDAAGTPLHQWPLPKAPGSFALRQGGGMLMAYRNGLALIDPFTGEFNDIPAGAAEFGKERFNDGKCDRRGRFWAGTFDKNLKDPVGSLFRIDPDLGVHRMDEGITLSNGIDWSPDDRVMYYCDSTPSVVRAYDFDLDAGTVGNRRVFVDFSSRAGRPDGCTVDAEGCLWVAEVGAGQIVRFDPDGREMEVVRLPVSRPTSVMFGGPELRTLFITSMQMDLSAEELAQQPQAGCVFALDVGVAGLPARRFAG